MHHLPKRKLTAAANMAVDELLLTDYPAPEQPRFRHYEWASPAFTFGRTQRFAEAELALPVHATWREAHDVFASKFALVRRCTGGGVVDHRDDWTYALVIPADHPLARAKAGAAYQQVHEMLAWALRAQGVAATLAPCPCDPTRAKPVDQSGADGGGVQISGEAPPPPSPPLGNETEISDDAVTRRAMAAVCFERAEPADVVDEDGAKLAGAAQRRTRDGLLMQGSLNRAAVRSVLWDRLERDFTGALAEWLGGAPTPQRFPKWPAEQLAAKIKHYESKDWNARR